MIQFCFNGKFYKEGTDVFSINNRAFRYGDALFETMYACYTNIHFFEEHLCRLKRGMSVLGMEIPVSFNSNYLYKKIYKLLNKNHHNKGVRIRLSVFRREGGLYTPIDNSISYCIETENLENTSYEFNKKGYSIDIYSDINKQYNVLSEFKTANSSLFIMAALWRKSQGLDDCIILNNNSNLCESMSSNIFLIKDDKLYTPSVESGCVAGVMRAAIIGIVRKMGFEVDDKSILSLDDMFAADEMFLTNSVSGIRKVLSFRNKRYYSIITKDIYNELVFKTRNVI